MTSNMTTPEEGSQRNPIASGSPPRLGLIVNPIAGIGGRVGLKGSDGLEIQRKALELGAVPQSANRAIQAAERLRPLTNLEIITYPGEMGARAARACGFEPTVIGVTQPGETTAKDTENAAKDMLRLKVGLLLFAGGDGTARDIYNAVGDLLLVLGVPAGVKIQSAVFGKSPQSAGDLALSFFQGSVISTREAEVIDIDEDAVRRGVISPKLYGYLRIPFQSRLVQSLKAPSGPGEQVAMEAIACDIVDSMEDGCLYILGPGTTTRAITSELGLEKTLIGVDIVANRALVAKDVNESQLLALVEGRRAKIIVTPIGGQGYIFGRGNQQISARVIQAVGKGNIMVVSTAAKMHSLGGRPLLVDTGDRTVDKSLSGYTSVVTGYQEEMIYRVSY